jgi:hypothetical protein
VDLSFLVKCFTQGRLEYVARIRTALVLKESLGKSPSTLGINRCEIPAKFFESEKGVNFSEDAHVSFLVSLQQLRVVNALQSDEGVNVEVLAVVDHILRVAEEDEVVISVTYFVSKVAILILHQLIVLIVFPNVIFLGKER